MSASPGNQSEHAGRDPRLSEPLASAQETASDMLEAEDALRLVRERFERTENPDVQAELAVAALGQVERQLELTRERRRNLDGIEGKLWSRRNRLEQFLIQARGTAWWHSHRQQF
jgi:hypothetical protein